MLAAIFTLLVVYQVKHFLADYPLQRPYMLGKFKPGWDFLGPLTAHAGCHALFTFFIAAFWLWKPFTDQTTLLPAGLALFDFVVHFTMDRIKAGPRYLGRFKVLSATEWVVLKATQTSNGGGFSEFEKRTKSNTFFWWSLGLDQMVHHLTHYAIIYFLVTA